MKVSIQLRKFGKSEAKVYFRLRDGLKDLKAASSLSIIPEFWDSVNYCYKKSTPTDIVSEEVQKNFNEAIKETLKRICEQYEDESDFLWLTTIISNTGNMVKPKPANSRESKETKKPKGRREYKTFKGEKTMVEYFHIYIETSHFNDWHQQAQVAVMRKVERFEKWLRFLNADPDFNLYLNFFDKDGTQQYLDYIYNEAELREKHPEHFAQFQLYADYNIRPISKNTLSSSAKRLFMFLNWSVTNGYLEHQQYNNVTIDQEVYGTPIYLTIEERNRIYNTDFSYDSRLDYHKDKFLFQCLIGCRNNDLNLLTWSHITEGNFIEYVPHKNLLNGKTDTVRCPLCDKAKEILDRLDPTMPYLFIRYCDEYYRRDIKKILMASGIDRIVTILDPKSRKPVQRPLYEVAASHLARRTFIANIYKQVHDPALISSLTGHTENSKAFERYRSIDDDMKKEILKFIK